jgi:uncharacterized protein (DUF305 family)
MAGIMSIPMLLIELFLMKSMYQNKKLNTLLIASSTIVFITLIIMVRKQIAIDDKEFLKSMIPHHAAALLMCKNAYLKDPEIQELCKKIRVTQQAEINFMRAKLEFMK